jgi:uncharacterized cupredoxin-like copper-binding protein
MQFQRRQGKMLKRSRFAALLLVVVVAALALAIPAGAASTVSVTAGKPTEYKFTLAKSVKAGKVTFKVTNKGKIPHDFSIAGKKTALLKPGKSATLTVTLKKGSSAYKCTVPGHAQAGMKGTLKVT